VGGRVTDTVCTGLLEGLETLRVSLSSLAPTSGAAMLPMRWGQNHTKYEKKPTHSLNFLLSCPVAHLCYSLVPQLSCQSVSCPTGTTN